MRRAGQKAGSLFVGRAAGVEGVDAESADAEAGSVPRCFTAKGDRDLYQEGLMGQGFASEVPEL
ncbi:hypothetical protein [Metabacillus sp. FJAT-52054]|uniref:Uncharacterized protein n=1 Tax=Metabacillus sediminis TaxID=3117746 RepID=A0ABZ2NKE6_9BACI